MDIKDLMDVAKTDLPKLAGPALKAIEGSKLDPTQKLLSITALVVVLRLLESIELLADRLDRIEGHVESMERSMDAIKRNMPT